MAEDQSVELSLSFSDIFLVLATVAAIYFGIRYLKNRKRFAKAPPQWKSNIPFIGVLYDFAKSPVQFVLEGRKRYGDVFTANMFGQRLTFLTHPAAHDLFFNATDEEVDVRAVYRFVVPVFGKGIVYDAPSHIMQQQLKIVATGLASSRYKAFIKVFEEESLMQLKKWDNEGTTDMFEYFAELIIATASRTLHGEEIRNKLNNSSFAQLYHDLDAGLDALTFLAPWLPTPAARKRDAARAQIVKTFYEIIANRRAAGTGPEDLLQSLIEGKYKDGRQISDDEICGILLASLFAGQHTSSITSTWTALLLIHHPEKLAKVREEQERLIEEHGPVFTWNHFKNMRYLEFCIREALRMFPPLIMLMRKVVVPRSYGDHVIPEGDIIVTSPAASGRCDKNFSNPDTFDPERFERGEDKAYNFAYIGFGGGRHKCVGENFAILQIKSIISVLFREYDLEPVSPFPTVNYESLVATPKLPCTIRYKRRTPVQ